MRRPALAAAGLLAAAASVRAADAPAVHDCLADPRRIEWIAGGYYEGRFDDGTPIEANLPAAAPPPVDRPVAVPAAYWFPRTFEGTPNALRVAAPRAPAAPGEFVLESPDGARRFEGRFEDDGARAVGSFADAERGIRLRFTLQRHASYRAVSLGWHARGDAGDPWRWQALWPELPEAALAADLRGRAGACEGALDARRVVTVAWRDTRTLAVYDDLSVFEDGAAHPEPDARFVNFAPPSGRPLPLDTFLDTSPDCLRTVSRFVAARLRDAQAAWPAQGALRPAGDPTTKESVGRPWPEASALALPRGLVFSFDPTEVGPYVQGRFRAFASTADLGKCLKDPAD